MAPSQVKSHLKDVLYWLVSLGWELGGGGKKRALDKPYKAHDPHMIDN